MIRVPEDVAGLQQAADRVAAGGTIVLGPAVYSESITISTPDVTLRGAGRNTTVIDGGGIRPYGVVAIADGIRIENLTVRNHSFYGALITGLHDQGGPRAPDEDAYEPFDPEQFPPVQRFAIEYVTAHNNGLYGLYAFNAQHGVIANSYASGSADSGIYIGQCRDCDILVRENVAERNAVGFENANASDPVVITGNRFSDNRVGMTLLSNYQEAFQPQRGNAVAGNVISGNAEPDSPAQADGGFGIGVGIAGGTANTIDRNRIEDNPRAGLVLTNTEDLPATGNRLTGNAFAGNGVDLANISAARAPAGATCASGKITTLPVALARQLGAGCAAAKSGLATAPPQALSAKVEAPEGASFRRVAPPKEQPDQPEHAIPAPRLPDRVTMPDLDAVKVPSADLLADRSGTR